MSGDEEEGTDHNIGTNDAMSNSSSGNNRKPQVTSESPEPREPDENETVRIGFEVGVNQVPRGAIAHCCVLYQIISHSILEEYDTESFLNPTLFRPRLLRGEVAQGFMTMTYVPAYVKIDNFRQAPHNKVQIQQLMYVLVFFLVAACVDHTGLSQFEGCSQSQ
jgi:hypothetical protein